MRQISRAYAWMLLVLSLILTGIFTLFALQTNQVLQEQLIERGRSFIQEIVLVRKWVARHDGVYVRRGPDAQINPFLSRIPGVEPMVRDLRGREYVLRNPAVVTMEISQMARKKGIFSFNLTSLTPMNPANRPDAFEEQALRDFRAGARESWRYETDQDGRHMLRYMAPLLTERDCLSCHPDYEVGQVRGGISIALPAETVLERIEQNRWLVAGGGVLVIAVVLLGFTGLGRRFSQEVHQAEGARQIAEQKFQVLFDHLRDGVFLLGPAPGPHRWQILDSNQAFRQLADCRRHADCGGQSCPEPDQIFGAQGWRDILDLLDEVRSQGVSEGAPPLVEIDLRREDGTSVPLELGATPIEMPQGRCMLCAARDISRRRQEENARRQQEQVLIQQSKLAAMGEMLGNIAHQWRTPLAGLNLVFQELLRMVRREQVDWERLDLCARRGKDSVEFMSQTIEDFRAFLRPSVHRELVDLDRAIEDILHIVSGTMNHKKISVEHRVADESLYFRGLSGEFKQAVLNVLTNARDAIEDHRRRAGVDSAGRIRIASTAAGEMLRVEICNDGSPIPDEVRERMFDLYFSTRKASEGTGIGLYMTRIIVEDHLGGRIGVRNLPDGVCFLIEIPRSSAPR